MASNLTSLKQLCEQNEAISKHIVFNFSDAHLALELCFADKFLIYYSKTSNSFLLFNFGSIYSGINNGESFQYFMFAPNLNELLEEINRILTFDFKEEFNVRTHKWYSAIPPWLNLDLSFVSADFAQIYLDLIQIVLTTANDLSHDETMHIHEVIYKLNIKLSSL